MMRGGFGTTERQVDGAGCGMRSVRAIDDYCGCTMILHRQPTLAGMAR